MTQFTQRVNVCYWWEGQGYSWLKTDALTPFSETNFQDFSRTEIDFSKTLNFRFALSVPRSQFKLSLPSTIYIFYLSSTDFQTISGPVAFFQDFPVLENATMKILDFPSVSGLVWTLMRALTVTYFSQLKLYLVSTSTAKVGEILNFVVQTN